MGAVSNDATFSLVHGTHFSLLNSSFDTRTNLSDPSKHSALLFLSVARARAGVVRMPGPV